MASLVANAASPSQANSLRFSKLVRSSGRESCEFLIETWVAHIVIVVGARHDWVVRPKHLVRAVQLSWRYFAMSCELSLTCSLLSLLNLSHGILFATHVCVCVELLGWERRCWLDQTSKVLALYWWTNLSFIEKWSLLPLRKQVFRNIFPSRLLTGPQSSAERVALEVFCVKALLFSCQYVKRFFLIDRAMVLLDAIFEGNLWLLDMSI